MSHNERIKSLARTSPAEEVYFNVARSLRRISAELRDNLSLSADARLAADYLETLSTCQEQIHKMDAALLQLQSKTVKR